MQRKIIILNHQVYFVEAQGRLVKAEFLNVNDLEENELDYLDFDKTIIGGAA